MKRIFRFLRGVLVISFLLILILLATSVFFKEKIKETCLENLNEVVNTDVDINDLDLTLFKRFPHLSLHFEGLKVKDAIDGGRDSLLVLENVYLGLDVLEFVKGNYVINYCELSKGYVHIKIDDEGKNNYTLFKTKKEKKDSASSFSFAIDELVLDSVEIAYIDQRVKNNHKVFARSANCSLDYEAGKETLLDINGDFFCHQIGIGQDKYLRRKRFKLDAEIGYDFSNHVVRFEETGVQIERAKFLVDGEIKAGEYNDWNLKISSPNSDVQSLVSLLPSGLSNKLADYKSSGSIYFNAGIKGIQSKTKSPAVDVNFGFSNASFFHPDLGQEIKDCKLKGTFTNGEKRSAITSVLKLKEFSGKLGDDLIKADLSYRNFTDPYLELDLKGNFSVESALKLYPVEQITHAKGRFKANLNFKGLVKDLTDPEKAKKIKTAGNFELIDADLDLSASQLALRSFNGMFHFDNHDLGITRFSGKIGGSDFELKGYFKNFISYVLLDHQILKVKANFQSDFIDLDEILSKGMVTEEESQEEKKEDSYSFRLSPYLAYDLDCDIKKLKIRRLRDSYVGENFKGRLSLKSQVLNYQNIKMSVAGGELTFNGVVNAMDSTRVHVRNNTDVKNIEVKKVFYLLENFGQTFITDKNLSGKLTANAETLMNFDDHLVLDLNSIKTMAEVNITNGALLNFEPMTELGDFLKKKKFKRYLKSSDFSKVSFSRLSNTIFIDRQLITIPEMLIQTDVASDMTINGSHSFGNDMNYHVNFPLINYNREVRLSQSGLDLDAQDRWVIYLDIVGDVDDYKIDFDESRSLGTAVKAVGGRVKQVFEEDKEEIGLDTTSVINNEDIIYEEF